MKVTNDRLSNIWELYAELCATWAFFLSLPLSRRLCARFLSPRKVLWQSGLGRRIWRTCCWPRACSPARRQQKTLQSFPQVMSQWCIKHRGGVVAKVIDEAFHVVKVFFDEEEMCDCEPCEMLLFELVPLVCVDGPLHVVTGKKTNMFQHYGHHVKQPLSCSSAPLPP